MSDSFSASSSSTSEETPQDIYARLSSEWFSLSSKTTLSTL